MITISVIGVFIFILFVICSQWILVYEPLNFFNNIWGQTYIIVYHLLALLLLRCYGMSVLTDPGSPPSTWIPEGKTKEDLAILVDQFKHLSRQSTKGKSTTVLVDDDLSTITIVNSKNSKNNNKARFCSQCCAFKPPRTHHCKQCKRCILKHDHHCPWIGNCTGFRNQKFFIQFLFYVVILTTITIVTLTISAFYILNVNLNLSESNSDKMKNYNNKNNSSNEIDFLVSSIAVTIMYIFNFSGVLPVLLGVSGLFFFQTEFLLGNFTPLERYDRKKEGKYARRNGLKYQWKYDKGWKLNFREVMGDTLIQWFFPIGFPKTDGTYWRENELYLQQQRLLNDSSSLITTSSTTTTTTTTIANAINNDNIKIPTQQQPINGANIGDDADDDDDDDDDESLEINDYIRSDSNSFSQPLISQSATQKPSFGFVENV
ncbi:hypothetical protein RB653_004237 [Dictyostelium firmibasis]|uniref:Palmitoyltransferase n=1 Tax=Dictyostelium firmibasis TaxID=79012 RepID=A0AAN7YZW6_9MYCE